MQNTSFQEAAFKNNRQNNSFQDFIFQSAGFQDAGFQNASFQNTSLSDIFSTLVNNLVNNAIGHGINTLQNLTSKAEDEFLLTVNEEQINDALYRFVTHNVDAILDMRIELYSGWFRLYCIANIKGIHAQVAGNFELVHIQLDQQRQRLVFAQQGETEVLDLHATSYLKKLAILYGLPIYRKVLEHDPLGDILKRINLARVKENIIYIDIGRWLRKNEKIMTTLYKAQVNYATVAEKQLILKAKINPRNLLATNTSGDIITEADNPDNNKLKV